LQLKSEDQTDVRRLAHTFKGTAATLGLDPLARLAAALENSLREHAVLRLTEQELQLALQNISQELIRLATALAAPAAVDPQPYAEPVDYEALKTTLKRLDGLLAQSDTSAIVLIDEHGAMMQAAFGARGEELVRLVQSFEFEAALKLLRSLTPTA
jgi:HPt (histidine-containing phosphotransfer) domain-containing protein